MGVTLAILTYKEEENLVTLLPAVIENLKKVTDDYEIVVVDSPKSQDNTKAVCEQYGAKYFLQEGPYYVSAYKTAIKNATKDIFFIIDADFSHPPEDIPKIYTAFVEGNCDMGIGSRYVEGGINDDLPKNIVYSKILNFVYRNAIGVIDSLTYWLIYCTEPIMDKLSPNYLGFTKWISNTFAIQFRDGCIAPAEIYHGDA